MIIGLCGTHGTGKSTIIQGVKNAGYSVHDTQLSRMVQASLGWKSLSEVQRSIDNMWQFQDAILEAMHDRDNEIINTGKPTLVERTPIDAWAYTEMWCYKLGIDLNDAWVLNYKNRCLKMALQYTHFLIIPISDDIPFVSDPNRADANSRELINDIIFDFIQYNVFPYSIISSTNKEDRIKETIEKIQTISKS